MYLTSSIMYKHKLLPIFILVLLIGKGVKAQSIDSALVAYNNRAPQEKVYVQFDNSKYAAGQTIWYKAYLMSGFQPSQLSKNFYIDWYDNEGKLISSTVTPVIYSYAAGNYKVPDNYSGNSIHAVAYTKWMRNFDSTYFFQQQFQIVSNKGIAAQKDVNVIESSIQFLPESGNILSNKLNIIAFKATNGIGLPENINGIIRNAKGDSVASFRTMHNGMGKFQFIPISNQVYTAVWKDAIGIIHKTNLPISEDIGVSLHLEPGRSNRIFQVQRTKESPVSMQQLTLVGQMNGSVLFMAKLNLTDKESITSTLPLSKMLTGMLQLTIFDVNNKPLCERVVFVKNEDYKLNTILNVDTFSTLKRAKNLIEIELKDTTYANLSIAITDANTSETLDNNIISHLLLNGELTGNIYKPAYYFSSNADSVAQHLDLVMLTNGWRRYNWQCIVSNPLPDLKFPKETEYQTLKGSITDYSSRKTKKPESINLIFVAKDSSNNMITLLILEDGTFVTKNAMLYDTTKVYFKVNGTSSVTNKNLVIENDFFKPDPNILINHFKSNYDTVGYSKLQYIIQEQAKLDAINKHNTLKEVTIYAKQKARLKELDKKYTFGVFSGEATAAFDMSTLQNASHTIDIFDFLTGKVPGLEVGNAIGGMATEGVVTYRGGTPSFFLDEMPIPTSQLRDINVSNIAYVKVFTSQFMAGLNNSVSTNMTEAKINGKVQTVTVATDNHASNAAIVMYSKRGGDLNSDSKGINTNGLDYKLYYGYTGNKEFYSPNYAEKSLDNVKDLRTTLFWNPWITLDKTNQKFKITFYNNDISTAFRVILEGMDSKGKLVSINKLLQ